MALAVRGWSHERKWHVVGADEALSRPTTELTPDHALELYDAYAALLCPRLFTCSPILPQRSLCPDDGHESAEIVIVLDGDGAASRSLFWQWPSGDLDGH